MVDDANTKMYTSHAQIYHTNYTTNIILNMTTLNTIHFFKAFYMNVNSITWINTVHDQKNPFNPIVPVGTVHGPAALG